MSNLTQIFELIKVLILIHTHGVESNSNLPAFLRFMVGDEETGKAGSILHAIRQAMLLNPSIPVRLYIPLSPWEMKTYGPNNLSNYPTLMEARRLLTDHADKFGIWDKERALELLDEAFYDDWGDVLLEQQNTRMEALRATAFAQSEGFTDIQPVSVGYGHAARAGVTDFTAAEPLGIHVAGHAPQSFPGHIKEQSVVFDPTFLCDSPYGQVPRNHEWHVLLPRLFAGLGKEGENASLLVEGISNMLKSYGITTNIRGEPL